jgi:hypothetical protein
MDFTRRYKKDDKFSFNYYLKQWNILTNQMFNWNLKSLFKIYTLGDE